MAIIVIIIPVEISHLGLITRDKGPVNVITRAAKLSGILSSHKLMSDVSHSREGNQLTDAVQTQQHSSQKHLASSS